MYTYSILTTSKGYIMRYKATQQSHWKNQIIDCIKYFLDNQNNSIRFANDYNTIQLICYLVNLQILNHKSGTIKVNSFNAKLYLNSKGL